MDSFKPDPHHTPGPWVVLPGQFKKRFQIRGPDEAGPVAAFVAGDIRKANADLIAQAPELAEACRALLICVEVNHSQEMKNDHFDNEHCCDCEAIKFARNILKKAAIRKKN